MDGMTLLLFVIGLVLLVVGARLLVGGASSLASSLGISPTIIALTIVAYSSSAPEVAIMIQSALTGDAGVGVGNILGTNVFNIFFVLGLAALIAPLYVSRETLRQDGAVMIGASVLLLILTLDNELSRFDGVLLVGILIAYTISLIRRARAESQEEKKEGEVSEAAPGPWPLQLGRVLFGIVLLVIGADWLVDGAVEVAEALALSPVVISLTIVAAGTSLPEVAATVQATLKGEREFAIGTILGSNIFNILGVLGIGALMSPNAISIPESALQFDVPVVIVVALAGLLTFTTGYRVTKLEGTLFLGFYALYTSWLILSAIGHDAFEWFRPLAIVLAVAGLILLLAHVIAQKRGEPREAA